MYEYEVKIRVKDKKKIMDQLKEKGCIFSAPLIQVDRIFTQKEIKGFEIPEGANVLRIREQNGVAMVTLKSRLKDHHNAMELETKIENGDIMVKALEQMGYEQKVCVSKTRNQTKYKEYAICMDEVEQLGSFMEIEYVSDIIEEEACYQKMIGIMKEFGLSEKNMVEEKYDTMMYRVLQK